MSAILGALIPLRAYALAYVLGARRVLGAARVAGGSPPRRATVPGRRCVAGVAGAPGGRGGGGGGVFHGDYVTACVVPRQPPRGRCGCDVRHIWERVLYQGLYQARYTARLLGRSDFREVVVPQ